LSSPPATRAETAPRGWEASLDLAFVAELADAAGGGGAATRLVRGGQSGPLAVQRPFFPEGPGVCHVYLLHPPGGLVGGDRLRVGVRVAAGAHALVTTPAAAKLYRSAGPTAWQEVRLDVEAGGALEWLPQETILYDGADADLRTRVDLGAGARFVGVDLLCFGLPARGEPFARGRCAQRLELWRDGRPLLLERGRFDGGAPVHAARWGLSGAPVVGTLLAAPAPASPDALAALRALAGELPAGDLGAATVLDGGQALACRYLGGSVERGGRFLKAAWAALRPALLGRDARAPRIWAT
jgi:urease accessory protein